MLKQTQTMNMSVKLFRHIGFESILEGEITEMGGAFVFKRKLDNLKSLFRFHRRKKNREEPENPIREKCDAQTGFYGESPRLYNEINGNDVENLYSDIISWMGV